MIGLLSNKSEYFYTAKWMSHAKKSQQGYFRFKILSDDNTDDIDLDNMGGMFGNAVWETKSGLPFEPDDYIYFRGQVYNIKIVDGNRKQEANKESAFMFFKQNGNIPIKLTLRKAGA